jgi:hypothetical protein
MVSKGENMKLKLSVILGFAILFSTNVHADWVNFSCYKNANQKGEETDKVYAYNESTHRVKLDKKDHDFAGKFRGNIITSELPSGKNKAEVKFDKSNGHLTMTMVGGMFNGRKFEMICFNDESLLKN